MPLGIRLFLKCEKDLQNLRLEGAESVSVPDGIVEKNIFKFLRRRGRTRGQADGNWGDEDLLSNNCPCPEVNVTHSQPVSSPARK